MSNSRKPVSFKLNDQEKDTSKPAKAKPTAERKPATEKLAASAEFKPQVEEPKARSPIKKAPRKPAAIKKSPALTQLPNEAAQARSADIEDLEPLPISSSSNGGWSWSRLFWWTLTALFSLGIGLWLDQLVRDLFARHTWLGWVGLAITGLFILAAISMAIREMFALSKLKSIKRLQEDARKAHENPDVKSAGEIKRSLTRLYKGRSRFSASIKKLNDDLGDSIEPRDTLELSERYLLGPLDKEATEIIIASAKRVSLVTAVSPRALVDIVYVLYENLRLISQLSNLYGGRTGSIGFFRLSKNVLLHLAATGAISVGDGLLQQIIGHGVSARLSAKLGEGVLNGLLTARIGISSMDICRPMPFNALSRPSVKDFLAHLGSLK